MATTTAPILALDTSAPPDYVVIDGVPYEVITSDDLTIREHQAVRRLMGERFEELYLKEDAGELTDAEADELSVLQSRICLVVLKAPPEVQAKLKDRQKGAVIMAFLGLWQQARGLMTRARIAPATTSTGESGSLDSAAPIPAPRHTAG